MLKFILAIVSSALPVTAAQQKLTSRHDPADQLFRRAPMAQSARSIVVPLQTDFHAAFDAELGRIHTIWRGGPLNLWGPPYSHAKSPFICDFDGDAVFTFPKFSPWFGENGQLSNSFSGMLTAGGRVAFEYVVSFGDTPVAVRESIQGASKENSWTVRRLFEFPKGTPGELKYLAFAEGGAKIVADGSGIKIEGTNGFTYVQLEGGNVQWRIADEPVNYSAEIVTDAGTEKGNPVVQFRGRENRAYLNIPKRAEPVSFALILSNTPEPLPVRSRNSAPNLRVFGAGEEIGRTSGDEFYRIEHFPLPAEAELIITGMDWLNERDLAVCTWLGEIYIVENATGAAAEARYRRFARGLNEPLGLTVANGEIFVVQKGELTRVSDTDNDGVADSFTCMGDDWGYSGNYHSYSFGPLVTAPNQFMVFITGQRGRYDLPYQGWAIRVGENGVTPFCSGLRVPHGWAIFQGDIFVADNQGNWVGGCKLNHLQEGKFYGFPSSLPSPKGARPETEVEPPALWFPRSLSPSASGIEIIETTALGPFEGQMLIGDFQNSILMRACLEKVGGKWQGAVFPFAKGFLSGVNRLAMGADGKLYVGGGKRTWSTAAPKEYSLDRVSFTGTRPFEVKEVRATREGFELRFTKPLEKEPALDPENYLVKQWRFKYHSDYGSPEFDHEGEPGATEVEVESATISADGTVVQLTIPALKEGFVTAFQLAVNSTDDEDLRNDAFYYTLNNKPE